MVGAVYGTSPIKPPNIHPPRPPIMRPPIIIRDPPRPPPRCFVKCQTVENYLCAGPISGCGQLKTFHNPCYLTSFNCQNTLNRNYLNFLNIIISVTDFSLYIRNHGKLKVHDVKENQ